MGSGGYTMDFRFEEFFAEWKANNANSDLDYEESLREVALAGWNAAMVYVLQIIEGSQG
jgi:hypothetical protein